MSAVTGRACPICGAIGSTCGPAGHGHPIEISDSQKGTDMTDLKVYTVRVHTGSGVKETQLRLTEADAKKRGAVLYEPTAEKPKATRRRRSSKEKVEVPTEPVKPAGDAGEGDEQKDAGENPEGEPSSEAGQSPAEEG